MSTIREERESPTDAELEEEDEAILKATQEGVDQALLEHKRAGNPICTLEDGKVKWIPPEEI